MGKKKLKKRIDILEKELDELRDAYFEKSQPIKLHKFVLKKTLVEDKNPLINAEEIQQLNQLVKEQLAKENYSTWLIKYIEEMKKDADVKFSWKEDGSGLWTFNWTYPHGYFDFGGSTS